MGFTDLFEGRAMTVTGIDKKGRIFRSTLTREFRLLAVANLLISLFLIYQGTVHGRIIAARGVPFIAIGILILVFLFFIALNTLGRILTITATGIEYRQGIRIVKIPFTSLVEFYPPPPMKKMFRKCLIGNGRETFIIDSFSFDDFELIVNIIEVARKKAKDRLTHHV
jgi:hypothetical protein